MHSSLRILQSTLIISVTVYAVTSAENNITTAPPKSSGTASSSATPKTSSVIVSPTTSVLDTPVKATQTTAASSKSNGAASSLATSKTSKASSSMQIVSSTTSVPVTPVNTMQTTAASPKSIVAKATLPSTTSIVSNSSMQTGSTNVHNHVNTSVATEQLTNASGVSTTVAASSKLLTSTSPKSSVSGNATQTGSQTINVSNSNTIELTTGKNKPVSGASTKATNLSSSGYLTRQTQSLITADYSLSSASRRTSIVLTTAESKQTLTTSLPVSVSVNWTDWSVDSSDCQKHCSGKGGTVTASRQCYSHSITLENEVCTRHDNLAKVVICGRKHCRISGIEAFGSSISTLAVSILLVMLSSTFVQG